MAVEQGICKKSGAWYSFDGDQIGQGREAAKRFMRDNPEIAMQLQDRVYQAVGLADLPEGEIDEDAVVGEDETVEAEESSSEK